MSGIENAISVVVKTATVKGTSLQANIDIFDTTLRDGSQAQGINFTLEDKLRIAERLDAFGVQFIEGGWPGSNPKDAQFFKAVQDIRLENARMVAFGSTRRKNLAVDKDPQVRLLLEAQTPCVAIVGKGHVNQVRDVLLCPPSENLRMIFDTIQFAKAHERFVIFDSEHAFDGYKHDPAYALQTWQAAKEAKADVIVLCDTNGGSLPHEVEQITQIAVASLGCQVGAHTHNDRELAVANSLAAVRAGATHVQGTINGYGERIGNCNLISFIPLLAFALKLKSVPETSLRQLRALSHFVDEVANLPHNPRQPWVGSSAFAHKGGAHVDAVNKQSSSYEHIEPALVGNRRSILVSDLSGRSNIVIKAQDLGHNLNHNSPDVETILRQVKHLENLGYEFEAAGASLWLLIEKTLRRHTPLFEVKSFKTVVESDEAGSVNYAMVRVLVKGELVEAEAEGDGPVNALDAALRAALLPFYPELASIKLAEYKVRILDNIRGTGSKTRVLIESTNGHEQWATVGVNDNIIQATLAALEESMMFGILKSLRSNKKPAQSETDAYCTAVLPFLNSFSTTIHSQPYFPHRDFYS